VANHPREHVAVITIAHGRHDHLERQIWGLTRQTRAPDAYVAVSMDDPRLGAVVAAAVPSSWDVMTPSVSLRRGRLPLAAARNEGARAALAEGATTLVFLDVDCIPSDRLVERYAAVLSVQRSQGLTHAGGPIVACGEVAYLPPLPAGVDYRDCDLRALASPHSARPGVSPGTVEPADDLRLFWSLSFGVTTADWGRIGGFDEDYLGYGGEDTDFGQRLGAAGGRMLWVGGAQAYHQHHVTTSPPVQHLEEIIDNANLFARRWGWWPMEGWLGAFEQAGLARRLEDGSWTRA
jgi:GT2 family glycosyltransferase